MSVHSWQACESTSSSRLHCPRACLLCTAPLGLMVRAGFGVFSHVLHWGLRARTDRSAAAVQFCVWRCGRDGVVGWPSVLLHTIQQRRLIHYLAAATCAAIHGQSQQ